MNKAELTPYLSQDSLSASSMTEAIAIEQAAYQISSTQVRADDISHVAVQNSRNR
jgi:hypothetical protein